MTERMEIKLKEPPPLREKKYRFAMLKGRFMFDKGNKVIG
jgi:hypothetical protein